LIFIISQERLIYHIDYDIRKSPRGVLNWWINDSGLNVALYIQGVEYMYTQQISSFNDIPIEIRSALTKNNSVLGYVEPKKEQPKPQEIPIDLKVND